MPKSKKRKSSQKSIVKPLNAASIKRAPTTFKIALEKVKTPDWMFETDPIFKSLYKKYLLGQISGFHTRIPICLVQEGFYLAKRNFEYVCDAPPENIIRGEVINIQQGGRPSLHLYVNQNPKTNTNVKFLCPDDVATCVAYKRLKIHSVPAVVFAPGSQKLPNSSMESKVHLSMVDRGPAFSKLTSIEAPSTLPSILGINLSECPTENIKKLSTSIKTLIVKLRLFHMPAERQLHYHHMVFSALVRAQETLQAIEILIEKNLWFQALALLRVLYELHLNFYFDWLQPETNYKFLAAASVFNKEKISKEKGKILNEFMNKGDLSRAAEDRANAIWRPVIVASTVSEKAKLPKVGILYHKDIYDFLSQISHQNFEVASIHANRFDDEKFLVIDQDTKITYIRFMDYIVSEFIQCVDHDIGVN